MKEMVNRKELNRHDIQEREMGENTTINKEKEGKTKAQKQRVINEGDHKKQIQKIK